MKRTPTVLDYTTLPEELHSFLRGARIFDSSCSPEARVYFIDRDGGYYLKRAKSGTLSREAMMTEYFHKKELSAEVLGYYTGDEDILFTCRVPGEDCTYGAYLDEPKRLCDTIAERLRALHETDFADCPAPDRTAEYIRLATENYKTGNYDTSHFPDSFGYRSAEEAWRVFSDGMSTLKCDTLLHGDFCLPNIMLDGWRFSGFIDLDHGGVGDRHVDLFWGTWSLTFNLKTAAYEERFLDAYGRDAVDTDLLRIVAAAEVFG